MIESVNASSKKRFVETKIYCQQEDAKCDFIFELKLIQFDKGKYFYFLYIFGFWPKDNSVTLYTVLPVIHLICLILMRNLLTNVFDYFFTLQENSIVLACLRIIVPPDDREIKLSNITGETRLFLELTNIHRTVAQYLTWSIVPVICPIDIRLKNLFRISSV